MSTGAIRTTRQLSNESTGLDVFVTGDLRGDSVFEHGKIEYTIVVVSNHSALQPSQSLHKDNTLQFSIRKTHADCLQLQTVLEDKFPELNIPQIPKVEKDSSLNACYRQKKLTLFFDFCAHSERISHCNELLQFLGVIAEMAEGAKKTPEKERHRRKSKRDNSDLFSDDKILEATDIDFTETSDHHFSPFDFLRGRKKKNSSSDPEKSPRSHFSLFKKDDINDNTVAEATTQKTKYTQIDTKESSKHDGFQDNSDLNELENIINKLHTPKQSQEDSIFEMDSPNDSCKSNVNTPYDTNTITTENIQNYISCNGMESENAILDLGL